MRTCRDCDYEGEEFYGRDSVCKECRRARRRSRYYADPEAARAASRKWHAENREAANAERRRRAADPAYHKPKARQTSCPRCGGSDFYQGTTQCRPCARADQRARYDPERERAWRRANPERVAAGRRRHYLRHRVAILQRRHRLVGEDASYAAILLADPCAYCGAQADSIDHIVPRSDRGELVWANLTAACRSCNSRKGARPLLEAMLGGLCRRKAESVVLK